MIACHDPNKYCNLHHKCGHDLEGCDVMQAQAKCMHLAWNSTSSAEEAAEKKSKQETHTLVKEMVSEYIAHQKRKRKNHDAEADWPEDESATSEQHYQKDDE